MKPFENTLDPSLLGHRGPAAWAVRQPLRALAGLREALTAAVARRAAAREQARTWRLLHGLSDAELRDIGLRRSELPWIPGRETIGDHRVF